MRFKKESFLQSSSTERGILLEVLWGKDSSRKSCILKRSPLPEPPPESNATQKRKNIETYDNHANRNLIIGNSKQRPKFDKLVWGVFGMIWDDMDAETPLEELRGKVALTQACICIRNPLREPPTERGILLGELWGKDTLRT